VAALRKVMVSVVVGNDWHHTSFKEYILHLEPVRFSIQRFKGYTKVLYGDFYTVIQRIPDKHWTEDSFQMEVLWEL
jgi:hypothetical protein